MPACSISCMKFLFVLDCSCNWELQLVNKHEANTLCELCGACCCFVLNFIWNFDFETVSFAEAVLNLFFNFEPKWTSCSLKCVFLPVCPAVRQKNWKLFCNAAKISELVSCTISIKTGCRYYHCNLKFASI